MTKQTWKTCYEDLAAAYDKPINAERMIKLYKALEDLPDEHMNEAITEVIRTERFFPVPAVIRQAVQAVSSRKYRYVNPLPWLGQSPPGGELSDAQKAEFQQLLRATKEKLFGRA